MPPCLQYFFSLSINRKRVLSKLKGSKDLYNLRHNVRIRKRYIYNLWIANINFPRFSNKLKFAKQGYVLWNLICWDLTNKVQSWSFQTSAIKRIFFPNKMKLTNYQIMYKCSLPRLQSMDFPVQLRPSSCHVQLQQIYFLRSKCFESTLQVVIFHRFRR